MLNFVPENSRFRCRHLDMKKARRTAHLEAQRKQQENTIQRAFIKYVSDATSDEVLKEVRGFYRKGRVENIVDLADSFVEDFADVLPEVFINTGTLQNKRLMRILDVRVVKIDVDASVNLSFQAGDAHASNLMRQAMLQLIREILQPQRDAIRNVMVEALDSGMGYIAAGNRFKDVIGLTAHQEAAVRNYERLLANGQSSALDRSLRDRRFDRTVRASIRDDKPLTDSQISRMVDRYRSRMIDMRAENIARTEGQKIVQQANQESLRQVTEKTGLEKERVKRTWMTTLDGRERDTHHEMDGQIRGMEEEFESPSGATALIPGSFGVAEEDINCRCVVDVTIDEAEDTITISTGQQQEAAQVVTPSPAQNFSVITDRDQHFALSQQYFDTGLTSALSEPETGAISDYTGVYFNRVNKHMRGLKYKGEDATEDTLKIVDSLKGVFDKASFPESVTTYRGLSENIFDSMFPDIGNGTSFVMDKSFISTSLSKDIGKDYVRSGGVMIEIRVPKGAKALSFGSLSKYDNEFEVVLAPSSEFLVVEKTAGKMVLELLIK